MWGKGAKYGSFNPRLNHKGNAHHTISVWPGYVGHGFATVSFGHMMNHFPFDEQAMREELRQRLNDIERIDLPADVVSKYPNIPLLGLSDEAAMQRFLETFDWYLDQIKSS